MACRWWRRARAPFPKLVEDGQTGLLFTPGDAADLAQSHERLLPDAGLRRRLSTAGRERMASTFTIDAVAERFLALHRAEIGDRRRDHARTDGISRMSLSRYSVPVRPPRRVGSGSGV